MKHVSQSAIEKHYMESVLPHPTYPVQKQIPKTKDFYKPQQFIWNNPHRASHQMYKFYHAYNEHYQKKKEPIIKHQEEMDRENAERQRIVRLIEFRNKTREEFSQKQKSRIKLESKVYSEVKNNEIMFRTDRGSRGNRFEEFDTKSVKIDNNMLGLQSHYGLTQVQDTQSVHPRSVHKNQAYTNFKSHRVQPRSQRIIRIEDTYKEGLKNYDIKTQQINRMIQDQNEQYHTKIRSEFLARKHVNDETNNRFYLKAKKFTME